MARNPKNTSKAPPKMKKDPFADRPSMRAEQQAHREANPLLLAERLAPLAIYATRATFINSISLQGKEGTTPQITTHVGPVGATEFQGNKHLIQRLWSDGHFLYIESEKYKPMAVPCSNILDLQMDMAHREFGKDEPPIAISKPAEVSSDTTTGGTEPHTPEVLVHTPLYSVKDPSLLLPNEVIAGWLEGELGPDRLPGEYLVLNFNHETNMVRLQAADLSLHPFKVHESLL